MTCALRGAQGGGDVPEAAAAGQRVAVRVRALGAHRDGADLWGRGGGPVPGGGAVLSGAEGVLLGSTQHLSGGRHSWQCRRGGVRDLQQAACLVHTSGSLAAPD